MTPAEYFHLKAFARVDGAWMALLWIASFACYIIGISQPIFGVTALMLAAATPFFMVRQLRRFRDYGREGVISMGRGWAYVVLVFFYAAILLALVQYAYMAYMDKGYLLMSLSNMMSTAEGQQVAATYGMGDRLEESLAMMQQMRPIDFALNMLTVNIMIGIVLGLPIGLLMQRRQTDGQPPTTQQ